MDPFDDRDNDEYDSDAISDESWRDYDEGEDEYYQADMDYDEDYI
jgi:hypothetical protein